MYATTSNVKLSRACAELKITHSSVLLILSKKSISKLIPKTIENRKKILCVRLRSGDKHHLRKYVDCKAQIRKAFFPLTGLICAFRSADFLRRCSSPRAQPHAQSLFLFSIIFGIHLSHEVRFSERERERDGSDVTIDVLKLAMSLHFPLPKIRTWRERDGSDVTIVGLK